MPPRRTTRSARPSVEPEQLPAKRKRTQEEPEQDQPHQPKTRRASSSTRSSLAPPARSRAQTRGKSSLDNVAEAEDDEDGDENAPPVKKSRPSLDTETPAEEESEKEEAPVRKTRRGSVQPKSTASANPPTRRGSSRRSSVAAQAGSGSTATTERPRRVSSRPVQIEEEEPVSEGGQQPPTSKPTKGKARVTKTPITPRTDSDEETGAAPLEEDNEEEEVSLPRSRRSKTPAAKSKPRAPPKKQAPKPVIEDSEPEEEVEKQEVPASSGSKVTTQAISQDNEEDEEETSLFEPPPIPLPSTLPQPPKEPEGPKPRLVIHKMALINFKSYAGRQEIGPFHKSFSSIVGPNGSGKSNTIDALLFVFGYRAVKMRQGKLSELIHNSARYPDLDQCSVEVHFREIIDVPGSEAFTVVPKSQLVVTRQAFKNNTSRYTINGINRTYTDVQKLLKDRGIDLDHKRFLILQGEVESIAQMKPKAVNEHDEGLLEYLEDIIGTSKYKTPIDDAMGEVERLQEERGQKLNRLRHVEREKNALEAKKKEAEDYLRLKNEHVRALSRLWQWYLWKCLSEEDELEKRLNQHKKDLQDEIDRNKDDITHLELLQKHYNEREAAYKEVQTAATEAVKDLAAHEKKEVGLQERRKHAASQAKKLKKALTEDTANRSTALQTIQMSGEKMKRERRKIEELEASLVEEEKTLEEIQNSLKDKTQVFHDQIEVKQRELQPWMARMDKTKAEINVATSERDALAKKAETLQNACREAQTTLEELQSDHTVKVREQTKLESNKSDLERQKKVAHAKLQESQQVLQEWKNKANSSRNKVEEARASQADNRSQNRVLDGLTRLKQTGRITGFHGRLGSLGTIPDEYDVAISTACGSLNHMVVDRVDQGQACIEYLRSQNIGRASFTILDKIPKNNGMEPMNTPENVPRLFDLVKPKEGRFAAAFYKALSNTLVAKDMEQANRIAFGGTKRWRVVTLAGQLIDTSGTMSGGGTHVARGGMSSKLAAEAVRPEVLREYEQESANAAERLEEAMRAARAAEGEVERLMNLGPQIETACEKLKMDIENGKKRIAEADKRVRELRAQTRPNTNDVARIAQLESQIANSTSELDKLTERSSTIQNAIKELEQRILDIGGSRLLTQKSRVDGIKLHINLANDEITKAEVAKAKAEKDSVKLDGTIKTNTQAVKEVEGEVQELEEKLEEVTSYVTELRAKVEAAQAAAEDEKGDLEKLKDELEEKEKGIQVFRRKKLELEQAIADTEKEYNENERRVDHWRTEHDKLTLEEIDDDDDDDEEDGEEEQAANVKVEGNVAAPEDGGEDGGDDDDDNEGEGEGEGEDNKPKDQKVKSEPGHAKVPQAPKKPPKRERTPPSELHIYSAEELSRFRKREMMADTELLDEKLKNAKADLSVLKEYRKREEEFLNRAKDLDTITSARDTQKQKYDGLRKQRLDEFMAGFNLISLKLKEMYQMITLGGNAELELVDSMDPFSEGIIFSVMPPKKSWKNISNLSGGEKTLSSLALVFALHVFKPTPLYFMDEIDAALDFRNVSIVANYIKDRTKNAQFIIISLRNDMFELSHRLIGIYKTANATRSISIDNHALTSAPLPGGTFTNAAAAVSGAMPPPTPSAAGATATAH